MSTYNKGDIPNAFFGIFGRFLPIAHFLHYGRVRRGGGVCMLSARVVVFTLRQSPQVVRLKYV